MRAAVFYGKRDLRVEEVAEPTPGAGQVKVEVAFSGVCGSDLHIFFNTDSPGTGVDYTQPHPLTGTVLPQIPGHEISGTVVEVGPGCSRVQVGDRVAVWPIYYCGECSACVIGAHGACLSVAFHGVSSAGGGMAEYTVVDESMVHTLPEGVDLRMGALVEPMAVGWHAVDLAHVAPGQTALVVGAGPIGIGVYFALKAAGVNTVVISEPSPSRRGALAGLGATFAVDPTCGDVLADIVHGVTGGAGVDVAFDTAGVGAALPPVISLLKPRGSLVVVALHEHEFAFNPVSLLWQETKMLGARCYTHEDYTNVIEAMAAGAYSAEGWVDEVALDNSVQALHDLREARSMKILIRPKS
jgi:(R,R)-butanediol dehydrogenase/meso-butanediol dehydrogenase/diacetyl reductase